MSLFQHVVGYLLYVSGQVGSREDGSPEQDFAAQVQLAFDNLQRLVVAAGASFDDIVDVTTFHTAPEAQFPIWLEAKARAFPEKPYPNWTAVGVTWLAGFDFEIKVIAKRKASIQVSHGNTLTDVSLVVSGH
ncbi:RidA family protein [Halovibrio sp. HP20-50]|uniref:RidA family protein n=1 Tax=Halovibrio sp. HP20-59 TaxID=3080275 RepID=UPI00294B7239|nr:RidA family protein [Halovibrio sp. HP20-59]MEA2119003.1 RidA family protein [Halovibrio sp. HP20-59]